VLFRYTREGARLAPAGFKAACRALRGILSDEQIGPPGLHPENLRNRPRRQEAMNR
jgi:hypothetical protein